MAKLCKAFCGSALFGRVPPWPYRKLENLRRKRYCNASLLLSTLSFSPEPYLSSTSRASSPTQPPSCVRLMRNMGGWEMACGWCVRWLCGRNVVAGFVEVSKIDVPPNPHMQLWNWCVAWWLRDYVRLMCQLKLWQWFCVREVCKMMSNPALRVVPDGRVNGAGDNMRKSKNAWRGEIGRKHPKNIVCV